MNSPMELEHNLILDGDSRDYLVWRSGMGRTIEIFDICVGSERRKGKGRRLVKMMLLEVAKYPKGKGPSLIYAMTRYDNAIAHQFYEYMGFRTLGKLHCFYRDGAGQNEHALVWGLDV
jgi:ribosomal protein S18 acetylase RimI-like enzyme